MTSTGIDESLVDEIVRRLLTVAKPDMIILFGSAATGTMTRDRDIDLLVIAVVNNSVRLTAASLRKLNPEMAANSYEVSPYLAEHSRLFCGRCGGRFFEEKRALRNLSVRNLSFLLAIAI